MADFEETVAGLRRWIAGHDPHVRAAVEYLIADGFWLEQEDFRKAAVPTDSRGTAWIAWDRASAFGKQAGASTSQKATLALAVAVGGDLYRISRMNDEEAEAAARLMVTATGMERMLRA